MPPASSDSSTAARRLLDLYGARPDFLLAQKPDGKALTLPCTAEEQVPAVAAHLEGTGPRVGALLVNGATCRLGASDLDGHGPHALADPPGIAESIARRLRDLGLQPIIEATKRNPGRRVLIFFTEPVEAAKARELFRRLHAAEGLASAVEIFPKQDSTTAANPGNGVWLSYFGPDVSDGRTVFLDSTGKPLDLLAALDAMADQAASAADLDRALALSLAWTPPGSSSPRAGPSDAGTAAGGPMVRLREALLSSPGARETSKGISICCVWHDDSRPSAVVYSDNLAVVCFACDYRAPLPEWIATPEGGALVGEALASEVLALKKRRPKASDGRGSETPWTETMLAEQVVSDHGPDLLFCGKWHKWIAWGGRRWLVDETGQVARHIKQTIRRLHVEALGDDELAKFFRAAEKRASRDNVQVLASREASVQIAPEDLDADPWLLNCRNGTIDLRTGKLRPHRREDYCTKLSPVDYDADAKAPIWDAFIERIFAGKSGLAEFAQKAAGYSLTGDTGEQCLFICWGSGANGKSTMLEALKAATGDYARAAPMDLFVASKGDRHPTEVASLLGVRFAPCVETRDGARLNETLLKQLTGGDTVQARRMREDFWEFSPVAKLWLGTNHRPAIRGTDPAIWRRIRLMPFTVTIPEDERDKKLPEKLRRELPGILAWAVRGCLAWQKDGLQSPAEVTGATDAYRQAEDRLGAFIAECCVTGAGKQVPFSDLHGAFVRWAEERREYVQTATAFGSALSDRGFEAGETGHAKTKIRKGIGLLEDVRVGAGESAGSSPTRARTETQPENPPAPTRTGPPDFVARILREREAKKASRS